MYVKNFGLWLGMGTRMYYTTELKANFKLEYISVCTYVQVHICVCGVRLYVCLELHIHTALKPPWRQADVEPDNQEGPGC